MVQLQPETKMSRSLDLTAVDNLGLDSRADGAGGGAKGLNLLHDSHGLGVSDLAEDDVLAVEPGGDNGGDEELGAVATERERLRQCQSRREPCQPVVNLRVGTSVGHGEQTGAVVLVLEVLIGELLAVDGATTGALCRMVRLATEHKRKLARRGKRNSRCGG